MKNIEKSLHVDSEAFKRIIKVLTETQNSKRLATTLRFHLLVEYYLDFIITSYLKRGFVITDNNITFSQKLNLVDSFGILPENIIISIKKLNALRNKSAHDIDYQITENDVDSIGRPFGKSYTDFVIRYLGRDLVADSDKAYFDAFLYNVFLLLLTEINFFIENKEVYSKAE
ncbi:MAG TPA: hypothetical protein VLK22_01555 [Candidatus Udaeobacter sp.]|nr:hypothetical protein [Candidatus Udaeobacter sp.]